MITAKVSAVVNGTSYSKEVEVVFYYDACGDHAAIVLEKDKDGDMKEVFTVSGCERQEYIKRRVESHLQDALACDFLRTLDVEWGA